MTEPNVHKSGKRRALIVLIAVFACVGLLLWFGKSSMNLQDGEYLGWFESLRESPWAPVYVVLTFVAAAFLGVPQWMLITGAVFAFGPLVGGLYSWGSTLISGTLNFWLGRWAGAKRVERYGGKRLTGLVQMIQRNGFMASLAVRVVPTGPFVLVNMVAGISGMRFLAFIAGTAIGILPKIAIIALLGQGILASNQGRIYMFGFLALALVLAFTIWVLKRKLRPVVTENTEKS